MATYNWYGGDNTFNCSTGEELSGLLYYDSTSSDGDRKLATEKNSNKVALYLGFAQSNPSENKGNFYAYDETKLSCDTTGCSWDVGTNMSDDTAGNIIFSLTKNTTGSSRTIKFKYDNSTIFSIIQAAYSNSTEKKTYTFNVIYQALLKDTDYCLVLVSSTNAYSFSYITNPELIDTDNNLNNMFIYNKTNSSDSMGLYITMSDSYRDSYNMTYISGNRTYFNMNDVYYFNYTLANCNVYNTLTKKFTKQKINISDKLALYTVDKNNKTCTQYTLLLFDDPDFVITLTY